jgi:hypothetical protein
MDKRFFYHNITINTFESFVIIILKKDIYNVLELQMFL